MANYGHAARRHNDSPPTKNSTFQKDYKSKGLVADDDDSNDDDVSDNDELLANFQATSKSKSKSPIDNSYNSPHDSRTRKSPDFKDTSKFMKNARDDEEFSRHSNPMMMTMKKPWKPMSSMRAASPPQRYEPKLGSYGEEDEDSDGSEKGFRKPTGKPSFLKSQPDARNRPKSPSIHGRHKSPVDLGHRKSPVDSGRHKSPVDSGRHKSPVDSGRHKSPVTAVVDSDSLDDRPIPTPRRQSKNELYKPNAVAVRRQSKPDDYDDVDGRRTPGNRRTSPVEAAHRKTPVDNRSTTPSRKTPIDDRKSPGIVDHNRKTPIEDRKSPTVGRKTPTDGRKMAVDERKKSIGDDRRTTPSRMFDEGRRSPKDEHGRRKSSVLDFLTDSKPARNSDSEDESVERRRRPSRGGDDGNRKSATSPSRKSPRGRNSPSSRTSTKSPGGSAKVKVISEKDRRSPSAGLRTTPSQRDREHSRDEKGKRSDDDNSSVCEEVVEEPVKVKVVKAAAMTDEGDSKTLGGEEQPTKQTSVHQITDVTIDKVGAAQTMRYIQPAKPADAKDIKMSNSLSALAEVHKPKPRYVKPTPEGAKRATSARTVAPKFDSTNDIREAIFEEWKVQRLARARQEALEKKRKQKEEEEKKEKATKEKVIEAKSAYNSWLEQKKDFVPTKTIQQKEAEKAAIKKEEENREKKRNAEMTYLKWKESNDEQLKEKKEKSTDATLR